MAVCAALNKCDVTKTTVWAQSHFSELRIAIQFIHPVIFSTPKHQYKNPLLHGSTYIFQQPRIC